MSLYNEDELTPPSWLNKDYLENVLRKYEQNDGVQVSNSTLKKNYLISNFSILIFQITDLNIMPASMKGDHYGSIMFRCKIEYLLDSNTKRNRSVIIKTIPEDKCVKRDMLSESKVFETEISMYTKTLPHIEEILKQNGEPTKLGAE